MLLALASYRGPEKIRDWQRDRILDAWGRRHMPQRTLQLLDRLERDGAIGRIEHHCALQFYQLFAEVALMPLPPEDMRRGKELGAIGAIAGAGERVDAVNHIVGMYQRDFAIAHARLTNPSAR
jgi:hypothetical protein